MPEDLLILLAHALGIAGVMLLTASAVRGALLAARATRWLRLLRGHKFRIHRVLSALGRGCSWRTPFRSCSRGGRRE